MKGDGDGRGEADCELDSCLGKDVRFSRDERGSSLFPSLHSFYLSVFTCVLHRLMMDDMQGREKTWLTNTVNSSQRSSQPSQHITSISGHATSQIKHYRCHFRRLMGEPFSIPLLGILLII